MKFIAVLVLMLGTVQFACALSVSDIELKSSLNQRLEAKIHLSSVNRDELNSLQIRINDIVGSTATVQSSNLRHEIIENDNGHYINITSQDVIREPVLSFSLELSWSKGRLIREYSLLLDPK